MFEDEISPLLVHLIQAVNDHLSTTCNSIVSLPSVLSRVDGENAPRHAPTRCGGGGGRSGSSHPLPEPSSQSPIEWVRRLNDVEQADWYFSHVICPEEIKQHRLWDRLLDESGYSPLSLAVRQPIQPCPNDLPHDLDPAVFTFKDAFEDLLAASAGQPMMSLQDRHEMNRTFQVVWGSPVEERFAWIRRLKNSGLYDAFHRPSWLSPSRSEPLSCQEWLDRRVEEARAQGHSTPFEPSGPLSRHRWYTLPDRRKAFWQSKQDARFIVELENQREQKRLLAFKDAIEVGSLPHAPTSPLSSDEMPHPARDGSRHHESTGLFDELEQVFGALGKVIEDDDSRQKSEKAKEEKPPMSKPSPSNPATQPNKPDTELDLYDVLQAVWKQGERSLATVINSWSKSFNLDFSPSWGDMTSSSAPSSRESRTTTDVKEDEHGVTKTTTEEWVDRWGNQHVKTKIKRVSMHGNHVATESYYSIRPAPRSSDPASTSSKRSSHEWQPDPADSVTPGQYPPDQVSTTKGPGDKSGRDEKRSGWFWSRN